MKIIRFIASLAFDAFIKAVTRPRTTYTKLAVTSLLISGSAFVTPLWQQAAGSVISSFDAQQCDNQIPSLAAGAIFLLLTGLFASLAQRHTPIQAEPIVDTKVISPPTSIGPSKVYCYCGSVLAISGIEAIVTSENTNLHLGSMNGTSVSGRIRRLAASFNSDGTLHTDLLQDHINDWKSKQLHAGPYPLGNCIESPPFNASHIGIKSVIHAIALQKSDSGINSIEESANRKIIEFTIAHCIKNNYSSVFIPVFGLGSGGIPREDAISKTLSPLIDKLSNNNHPLNIYIGTYRRTDAALVANEILKRA